MMEGSPYLNLSVKEPEKTLKFLTQYLGFFNYRNLQPLPSARETGVLIGNKFGNNYFIQGRAYKQADEGVKPIVINTDDCLRDYHHLNASGIKFSRAPRYTPNGLEVVFVDAYGNKYTLLEKRDYSED